MGLFSKKKTAPTVDDLQVEIADQVRNELIQEGREKLNQLISEQSDGLRQNIDEMMRQVGADMKEYMAKQLDVTVARVNTEITNQLHERIAEYNRTSSEAQELVVQSLSKNAQLVHERYQQMSTNLQEIIAKQELEMVSVFQANKAQLSSSQRAQDALVSQLQTAANNADQQIDQLAQAMRHNVSTQATRFSKVYQDNLDRATKSGEVQERMIQSLGDSVGALEQQYQQLSQLLDESLSKQKQMVVDVIHENMSRIVEHYVISALGSQADVKDQMPLILRQMEENKQAMLEDMSI